MRICKEGFLNDFVKSTIDGGWGLPEWIVSQMTETRGYSTTDIYDVIQASELDTSIKALSRDHVIEILGWMIGKTFTG